MWTFCHRAAARAGGVVRRHRHRPFATTPDGDRHHDYLALHEPEDAEASPAAAAPPVGAGLTAISAQLDRMRLQRDSADCEAVIRTSFGVIRLDSDNQPVTHGQFEPRETAAADEVEVDTFGEMEVAGLAWSGSRAADPDPAPVRDRPRSRADLSRPGPQGSPTESAESRHHAGSPFADPATFVDSQYFPEMDAVAASAASDIDTAAQSDGGATLRGNPEGAFEEQYFAGAFDGGAPRTSPPPTTSPIKRPLAGDAKLAEKPDGVFDEQYFRSAFEEVGEEREAAAYKASLAARHGRVWGAERRARHAHAEGVPQLERTSAPQAQRPQASPGKEKGSQLASQAEKRSEPGGEERRPAAGPQRQERQVRSGADRGGANSGASAVRREASSDTGGGPGAGADGDPQSGLAMVRELRAAARLAAAPAGRGRQLRAEVPDLASQPAHAVAALLRRGVLHNGPDLAVLYKPFGMAVHSVTERTPHCLAQFLPGLARHLGCERLFTVHRLDRDTTGAILVAKSLDSARRLHDLFREGRVVKTYWALVKGVPEQRRAVINMPVEEGTVSGRTRMTLAAAGSGDVTPPAAHAALTRYRVLSAAAGCALLELTPTTGVKHQLRVHLGLGLGCPVLGDHKYSRWTAADRPQRLPGAALQALAIRQPEARHLPMHLHARALWLPGLEGRVTAPLPLFFKRNLRRLGLSAGQRRPAEKGQ